MDRRKCVPSCLLNISVGTMLEHSLRPELHEDKKVILEFEFKS